jgi:hypothetical protein
MSSNGLCVKGRGAEHQADVLGEFAFTPAFSLPIRLFLEAKFNQKKCELRVVRNAHGIIHDINENFVHGPGNRLRKRCRYVYALFSTSGFTETAQDFAVAQQISLVDLSGASFAWLRHSIESAAEELYIFQVHYQVRQFPVRWMRNQLRRMLGTMPDILYEAGYQEAPDLVDDEKYLQTKAFGFPQVAAPVLGHLSDTLKERQQNELLLGFPAAPFILPLAADDIEPFLSYARDHPEHAIRLRRTGEGREAEWSVSPAGEWEDSLFAAPEGYRLTFNLPERLEVWISEHEEHRASRIRAIKTQFLSEIIIYRLEGDSLQTFQLQYVPSDLRRGGHRDLRHRQVGKDGVPELVVQRLQRVGGDGGKSLLSGGVPGMDHAAQCPLRLRGPDRARVGLGAVLEVPQQVRQARLLPGDVLPPGAEGQPATGWANTRHKPRSPPCTRTPGAHPRRTGCRSCSGRTNCSSPEPGGAAQPRSGGWGGRRTAGRPCGAG